MEILKPLRHIDASLPGPLVIGVHSGASTASGQL
jgi:hypothetical protein